MGFKNLLKTMHQPLWLLGIAIFFHTNAMLLAQSAIYSDFSQIQATVFLTPGYSHDPLSSSFDTLEERTIIDYKEKALEIGRSWISGMIFGYNFVFRPADRLRRVAEVWELNPLYQIQAEEIEEQEFLLNEEYIEMRIRYLPLQQEIVRLEGWRTTAFPNSAGTSQIPDLASMENRLEAFEEAVKDALQNHFRRITRNKPKELRGRIALFEIPRIVSRAGLIYASVKIIIDSTTIEQYEEF